MALNTAPHYQIPRTTLLWLLALLALLIAPHAGWLPPWVLLLSGICIGWRILIHLGKAAYPSILIRALMVIIAIPLSVYEFSAQGEGVGVDLSVSLLVLGASFKLLEMRYRRDIYILVTLTFMLALTGFIYSQTLLSTTYNLGAMLLAVTVMVLLNRDNVNERGTQRSSLKLAAILLIQSIPVMLVLFLLVPRIAPLWAMPLPGGASRTGVTDEMTPGDITQLGRSGELAFRVTFTGETPPHEALYWRGLVLDNFDGQTWRRSSSMLLPRAAADRATPADFQAPAGPGILEYDVILEPTQQNWLYGIKLAQVNLPDVILDRFDTLQGARPVTQRLRYLVRSAPDEGREQTLSATTRARSLQLPEDNPRTRGYARELRARYGDDRDLVQALLAGFREQEFYYTLTPPALQSDTIDAFFFDTRQGFCGHYAGSFVYLLRAAGIPARVVVGYQGAEANPFENYLMVYQYNAHAWAEVWLDGEGWVRFDPTAWVAPERIIQGVEAYFGAPSEFIEDSRFPLLRMRNSALLNTLRLRLDAMEYSWNRWVVGYDGGRQQRLLEDVFGEEETQQRSLYALFFLVAGSFTLIAAFMFWRRRRPGRDPVVAWYLEMTETLAARGYPRLPGEGPVDYCERVAAELPEMAYPLRRITQLFLRIVYITPTGADAPAVPHGELAMAYRHSLRQQIRKFRAQLQS